MYKNIVRFIFVDRWTDPSIIQQFLKEIKAEYGDIMYLTIVH